MSAPDPIGLMLHRLVRDCVAGRLQEIARTYEFDDRVLDGPTVASELRERADEARAGGGAS